MRDGDASVKQELLRGLAQIRRSNPANRRALQTELRQTLARLRSVRASTAAGRRARALAIQGFESTLEGVKSQLAFSENDSGNIEAATRDAKRADRYLGLGANRLRAAGRALGARVGELDGY
jgi:hypothetical protein